jgi:DNA-directed RNA polymerase II subunit RPB1
MIYENTQIDRIEFKIFTNNEIKEYSVINGENEQEGITIPESYENNEPKRGGLIDTRLGTTNYNQLCATCNLDNINCPGHFGHILLAEKVFNYAFFKHVKSLLECICIFCSKTLLNVNTLNINELNSLKHKKSKIRFNEVKKMVKNKTYCTNCNKSVAKIKQDKKYGIL